MRQEVMMSMEKDIAGFMQKYLVPIEKIWQPADFLPDPKAPDLPKKSANCRVKPGNWNTISGLC
jgi:hypothetical protein